MVNATEDQTTLISSADAETRPAGGTLTHRLLVQGEPLPVFDTMVDVVEEYRDQLRQRMSGRNLPPRLQDALLNGAVLWNGEEPPEIRPVARHSGVGPTAAEVLAADRE
ncbi:MAG TPA: hypothetical protein VGX50_17670 [Longimicrobium sp.]|jgi:hypothetical protein|nr:hypothetical protein [Longimicrobium sp.]